MEQEKIRAVFMRGGSSKGLYFHERDLPRDPEVRNRAILAAYGSPDPNGRQIDGMGGAVSTASKVAIISPSEDPNYDVNYLFGQVSIDKPIIDYKGNCGNISSGVGPFAIDEGMVPIREPVTSVRIFQVNTKTEIIADVPVKDSRHLVEGDYVVDGVPGAGAKINLRFINPAGSVTGKLLPTGNVTDVIEIPKTGEFTVSIVDAANPVVFVLAAELGLKGTEIDIIDGDPLIKEKLEAIRSYAAVLIGLAKTPEEASEKSQAVPKVAMVSAPRSYEAVTGKIIKSEEIDIVSRIMSMGTLHKSYALTGAICTAGAAKISGTVVNRASRDGVSEKDEVVIGHPGGVTSIVPSMEKKDGEFIYLEAGAGRTARRLMEGHVCVPKKFFQR